MGRTYYGDVSPDFDDWGPELLDEMEYRLGQLAPAEGAKFVYEYDFGDGWEHVLLVEKIHPPEKGVHYPRCIKGKRACPPEDVGGIWGYADFVKTIQDPSHPEHEDMLEWVGGHFDPEEFDLDAVNEALQRYL